MDPQSYLPAAEPGVKVFDELMQDGRPSGSPAGMGHLIELQALRALALAAGGEHTAAVAALAEALTLAHPQVHLRVIADEGAPMTALLGRLIATQSPTQTAAAMPGLIEPLTAREMQVLTLLAVGWSNGRIAAELYVTLDTVKKHVGHILDKLGAANRTEAAARARRLGLIGYSEVQVATTALGGDLALGRTAPRDRQWPTPRSPDRSSGGASSTAAQEIGSRDEYIASQPEPSLSSKAPARNDRGSRCAPSVVRE